MVKLASYQARSLQFKSHLGFFPGLKIPWLLHGVFLWLPPSL